MNVESHEEVEADTGGCPYCGHSERCVFCRSDRERARKEDESATGTEEGEKR